MPIYKKGDKTDCINYRGILLISTMYNVLPKVMLSRLLHSQMNLLGTINVDFDATGRLLVTYSAFVRYLGKNGNKMKQWISCL